MINLIITDCVSCLKTGVLDSTIDCPAEQHLGKQTNTFQCRFTDVVKKEYSHTSAFCGCSFTVIQSQLQTYKSYLH